MPDGDAHAERADRPGTRRRRGRRGLVRRVRRNLVLWSGGTTLVVLMVLGGRPLRRGRRLAREQWRRPARGRDGVPRAVLTGQRPDAGDDLPVRFSFGGAGRSRSRSTRTTMSSPGRATSGCRRACPTSDRRRRRPRDRARTCARRSSAPGRRPVRILTADDPRAAGRQVFTIQVIQDRTAELRTLQRDARGAAGRRGWWSCWSPSGSAPSTRAVRSSRSANRSAASASALRRQRDFAADASHELRTPLTVIRSSVEHLQRHKDRAGRRGRGRARGHRCRGPPHDRDRRGPAAARTLRLGRDRPRPPARGPRGCRGRRRVRAGQARGRRRGPGRGGPAARRS